MVRSSTREKNSFASWNRPRLRIPSKIVLPADDDLANLRMTRLQGSRSAQGCGSLAALTVAAIDVLTERS